VRKQRLLVERGSPKIGACRGSHVPSTLPPTGTLRQARRTLATTGEKLLSQEDPLPIIATRTRYAVLVPLAALVIVVSCGRQLQRIVSVNQPPDARIVSSEAVVPTAGASTTQVIVRWRGSDPDGRIDHYLVAVNPRSLEHCHGQDHGRIGARGTGAHDSSWV
jgi:hypothetical protein